MSFNRIGLFDGIVFDGTFQVKVEAFSNSTGRQFTEAKKQFVS